MKRIFDMFFSFIGLALLVVPFIIIAFLIKLDSKGSVFYKQVRVGKDEKDFYLFKFRSMKPNTDRFGLITVGNKDSRITRLGYYLRKYKIDELPQLINVLMGNMSLVGPRPEVRKYVDLYTQEQKKVFSVKPGITDYASIEYSDENERLAQTGDSEKLYVNEIMPVKLQLNLRYIAEQSMITDMKIILKTIRKILTR